VKIDGVPFTAADWMGLPAVEHKGETGTSFWRTFEAGDVRSRIVEYSSGYRADHWCARGHVLIVVEGELSVALRDGTVHRLAAGMGFLASDDEGNPHLAWSEKGARVFIVD